MDHLPIRYDATAVFAPQYFGSIWYYAYMAQFKRAAIDLELRYDKRFKSVHRCEIVDTQGLLRLTVPVSKPKDDEPTRFWRQVSVSSHGQWWSDHMISLESAYGRTPFFEFYIDRFKPWISNVDMSITDFDKGLDIEIRRILGLETEIAYAAPDCGEIVDVRRNQFSEMPIVPYYQVRAAKLGFVPGLSILDLIFNMGPEAPLVLRAMR